MRKFRRKQFFYRKKAHNIDEIHKNDNFYSFKLNLCGFRLTKITTRIPWNGIKKDKAFV